MAERRWHTRQSPEPHLSIHGEAGEHEVDVPALGADVAHAVHVQLHTGRLWGSDKRQGSMRAGNTLPRQTASTIVACKALHDQN